jgi:hypothetical protein
MANARESSGLAERGGHPGQRPDAQGHRAGRDRLYGNNGLRAGNFSTAGGSPNTIDTVENVILERPAAGTWTVEVLATQVNVDAHKETFATDADYALVVS